MPDVQFDPSGSEALNVADPAIENEEPVTYGQAMVGPNSNEWKSAIATEMDALKRNKTWIEVDQPKDRKLIDSKWVFKIKRLANGDIDKFKARVVAKGFSQIQGRDYDETFAPVVRFDSLRLLMALAAKNRYVPRQLDIKAAFLYGDLDAQIYMRLPEGHRSHGKVALLKKCIYGLKQSPRKWYFRLIEHLSAIGFTVSNFDPCVLRHNRQPFFIAVYVDDLTLYGPPEQLMETTVNALKKEFQVTDMGDLNWLLGIQIEILSDSIRLSQTAYIDKILERFQMSDSHPTALPIDPNTRLIKEDKPLGPAEHRIYQSIIGSINYLVTCTRPDLAYPVSYLSQFLASPSPTHMTAAKRLLKYVKGTRDLGLIFPFSNGSALTLEGYSDSDFGNCLDSRQSISGNVFRLNNSTICWRSKKQKSVATSTCEAEYMALSLALKQWIWLTSALKELQSTPDNSAMFCDNKAAIDIAHNHRIGDRSKHIDVAFHFVRERVETGEVTLLQIESANNLADICTKGLPQVLLSRLRGKLLEGI